MSVFIYMAQDSFEDQMKDFGRVLRVQPETEEKQEICYVTSVVIPTISIIGIIGNVTCIAVWSKYQNKSSYYAYLLGKENYSSSFFRQKL